jgi:hypothetical protein
MTLTVPIKSATCGRSPKCVDVSKTAKELHAFRTDRAQRNFGALLLPLAHRCERRLEQVDVEAACQSTIRADDDETHRLRLTLDQIRMLVIRIGVAQVADHAANLLRIRASRAHAVLRLAHLARGDHFHRLRDLLRVLEARDLDADFFYAGHGNARYLVDW